nr:hypothetical protein Iba_chr02bCG11220 [Ipomoea batatas]
MLGGSISLQVQDHKKYTSTVLNKQFHCSKVIVVEVVLGYDLGAASQRLLRGETQVVGEADVVDQAVVAGEDDAGTVAAAVWEVFGGGGLEAAVASVQVDLPLDKERLVGNCGGGNSGGGGKGAESE